MRSKHMYLLACVLMIAGTALSVQPKTGPGVTGAASPQGGKRLSTAHLRITAALCDAGITRGWVDPMIAVVMMTPGGSPVGQVGAINCWCKPDTCPGTLRKIKLPPGIFFLAIQVQDRTYRRTGGKKGKCETLGYYQGPGGGGLVHDSDHALRFSVDGKGTPLDVNINFVQH